MRPSSRRRPPRSPRPAPAAVQACGRGRPAPPSGAVPRSVRDPPSHPRPVRSAAGSGAVRGRRSVRCRSDPMPIRSRTASRVPCSMCGPARPTVVEPPRGDPPAPGCPAANTPSTSRPGSRGRTSRRPGRDPVAPVRLSRYPRRAGHEAGTARPGSPPVGWSRGDSNPGPPPCKGGALPAKLRPRSEPSARGPQHELTTERRRLAGGRAWTRTRGLGLIRAAL